MVSVEQMEALVSFLERHRDLALGRCCRTKEGRMLSRRLWAECGNILNSLSPDSHHKTSENWRIFYNDYKSKLLKKIKKMKAEQRATGGGPKIPIELTGLQERLHIILGKDVGEPLIGVRHNPLSENNMNANNVIELSNGDFVLNEQEIETEQNYEEEREFEFIFRNSEHSSVRLLSPPPPAETPVPPIAPTPIPPTAPTPVPPTAPTPVPPTAPTPATSNTPAPSEPTRRRRRSPRRRRPDSHTETANGVMSSLEATQREVAEVSRSALMEHARATNNLAAAIEKLAESYRRPIKIKIVNTSSAMITNAVVCSSDSE